MVPFFHLLSFNSKHRPFFFALVCDMRTSLQQVLSFLSGFLLFHFTRGTRWRSERKKYGERNYSVLFACPSYQPFPRVSIWPGSCWFQFQIFQSSRTSVRHPPSQRLLQQPGNGSSIDSSASTSRGPISNSPGCHEYCFPYPGLSASKWSPFGFPTCHQPWNNFPYIRIPLLNYLI